MNALNEVRCFSCSARVGMTPATALRTRVYCDEWCSNETPIGSNETRDDLIVNLALLGKTTSELALSFDLSRPRVHDIIANRLSLPSLATLVA